MILRDAAFFVTFAAAHWLLHWTFPMGGLAPNLLFAAALSAAILGGPVRGIALPFLFGFYADLCGAGMAGSWALLYTLIGYLVQVMKRHFDLTSPFSQAAAAVALSFLSLAAYQSAYMVISGVSPLPMKSLLFEPPISAFIIIPVFVITRRIYGRTR